ncbi:MAG: hypothetical protein JO157_09730 [Acetobacteraceae bacterium]|nr:hypothetical protein [Acetobacteraceae bacterium]
MRPLDAEEARQVADAIARAVDTYQVQQSSVRSRGLADPVGAQGRIRNGLLGYGVLQPLMDDAGVSDILVNTHNLVYVFADGRFARANGVRFASEEALRRARARGGAGGA